MRKVSIDDQIVSVQVFKMHYLMVYFMALKKFLEHSPLASNKKGMLEGTSC